VVIEEWSSPFLSVTETISYIETGGPVGCNDDRVVTWSPGDLPKVVLGVGEISVSAVEELGLDWLLRDPGPRLSGALHKLVDLRGIFDADDHA
jgi:hypothetical protein